MPGDPRADREVHHLSGENEGRHHPHQRCRSVLEPPLDGLESVKEARRAHDARQRRHAGIENRVRNMHASNPEPVHIMANQKTLTHLIIMPVCRLVKNFIPRFGKWTMSLARRAGTRLLSRLELVPCGSGFVAWTRSSRQVRL